MKKEKKHLSQYHLNFIEGVRLMMASRQLESLKDAAEFLGVPKLSLYKIMDGTNKPTADQGILLCQKGEFQANWLFTNTGKSTGDEAPDLSVIHEQLKEIKKLLSAKKHR